MKATLLQVMDDLEKEREIMGGFSKDESYHIVRDFSLNVFTKADELERNPATTSPGDYKEVARAFYSAGVFFDALNVFVSGGLDEAILEKSDIDKKRKYCKWKAAEILKALKEGTPIPKSGGIGEEEKTAEESKADAERKASPPPEAASSKADDDGWDIPAAPTGAGKKNPFVPPPEDKFVPPPQQPTNPPPVYQPPVYQPAAAPAPSKSIFSSKKSETKGGGTSADKLKDAIELTKFGLAALETREIDIAKDRLRAALEALG